jgi:hypothetical protein
MLKSRILQIEVFMKRRLAFISLFLISMNSFANCPIFASGSYTCSSKGEEEVNNVSQSVENGAQKYVIGEYIFITDGVARPLVDEGIELGDISSICNKGSIEVTMIDVQKEIPGGSLKIIVSPEGNGFKLTSVINIPGEDTINELMSSCRK